MSKKSIIESLLSGYAHGLLTMEEKSQLFDLLADNSNEIIFREVLLKNLNSASEFELTTGKEPDFSGMYQKISEEMDRKDSEETELKLFRRKSLYRRIFAYSSAAAAMFVFAFFIGRFSERNVVSDLKSSTALYEVTTPFGSRSEIKLPDGTQVILNAGSIVTYRNDYNSTNRNISLAGEAYFKVARNENIPFIVNVGSVSIKALGTEFNVKAYTDENIIETTLITGKINITCEGTGDSTQTVDLIPNQKAIFIRDEQGFLLEDLRESDSTNLEPVRSIISNILIAPKVNTDQVVAWTEGKLILRGESLDKLCVELERKYDVSVVFLDDEIKKFRYTGVLLDETLEQVLNVIGLTSPIRYSLDGKTVYLNSNPNSLNGFSKFMK
jgi:ferric-dicitrate binding protein FerR (iron transport regulator)